MANVSISFALSDKTFSLELSHRDNGILLGPEWLMTEGHGFAKAIGVFEHFSVAAGVPEGTQTSKSRIAVKLAVESLLTRLRDDEDLLGFDYSYSDPDIPRSEQGGKQSGYRSFGYLATISARPSGFCQLKLSEVAPTGRGRTVGLLDVRNRASITLDSGGDIRIRRRKADFDLISKLEQLHAFLDNCRSKEVLIIFSRV